MSAAEIESPINVLLVDDTPANLQVLGGMLKDQGCIVRPAPSGKLAIRFAEADPPDIVLLDIMMPEMDGYEVCRCLKNIECLAQVPVIFISALHETADKIKAFAAGGVDYISKPFQFDEVKARVRTHVKIRRLQMQLENQNRELSDLNQALRKSQDALDRELAYAAEYVLSLIPPPIREGAVKTDWLYIPSEQLGGDSLGYHWVDATHFAFYLLDVSGHGAGPALLSVSVLNALRTQCLPDADFLCPEQVLAALNTRFRGRDQYGQFFSIWYGLYDREIHVLQYAGAGHPPPVLIDAHGRATELDSLGVPIGLFPDAKYQAAAVPVSPPSRIYVFSDGCYEIQRLNGEQWTRADMIEYLSGVAADGSASDLESLYHRCVKMRGRECLEDDFSIICATFS